MERYKFDITAQTLTLSAAFAEAMNDPTSAEYALVCRFQRDFPSLRIVRKTHATPTRYKNSDGSITTRNKHNGLTYERMERFMSALGDDGVDYLEAYFTLREKAEAMCASPYTVVSAWFMKQFPKFRSNPLFYLDERPAIIDFSALVEKAKKPSAIEGESDKEIA
jgi:hypothetical protein